MIIFQRAATSKILEGAKYFPVIAILGPRQSGKTTLAQTIFPQHRPSVAISHQTASAASLSPTYIAVFSVDEHPL